MAQLMQPCCRTVFGDREAYQVEFVGHRPGGDLDAVVSVTPYDDPGHITYLPFRRSGRTWRPLAGLTHVLDDAIRIAERSTRYAGWDRPELAAVLATTDGGRP